MKAVTKKQKAKPGFFERFANWGAKAAGSTAAFLSAFAIIVLWALTGPIFNYSETWQLIINTGTTIITFLMVFLIHRAAWRTRQVIIDKNCSEEMQLHF